MVCAYLWGELLSLVGVGEEEVRLLFLMTCSGEPVSWRSSTARSPRMLALYPSLG